MKELVRIANADVQGKKPVYHALTKIAGVNLSFSNAVCHMLSIPKTRKIGELSEDELHRVEGLIRDPQGIPSFLYNRRKDVETGKDKHIISTDLKLQKEFDVRRLKKIKCYRGMRHAYGLPVRGQRTRGNFRTGATVGVMKKAAKIAAAKAGAAPEKTEKKK